MPAFFNRPKALLTSSFVSPFLIISRIRGLPLSTPRVTLWKLASFIFMTRASSSVSALTPPVNSKQFNPFLIICSSSSMVLFLTTVNVSSTTFTTKRPGRSSGAPVPSPNPEAPSNASFLSRSSSSIMELTDLRRAFLPQMLRDAQ